MIIFRVQVVTIYKVGVIPEQNVDEMDGNSLEPSPSSHLLKTACHCHIRAGAWGNNNKQHIYQHVNFINSYQAINIQMNKRANKSDLQEMRS